MYLVRHGEALAPHVLTGQADAPLSPLGEEQALALGRTLSGTPFARAWSSPLQRAERTAALILSAAASGPDALTGVTAVPELREISLGRWEGLPSRDIRQQWPELWAARGEQPMAFRPPEGESFADLANRVLPAFSALCAEAEQFPAVLLVAHQAVNRLIIAAVQNLRPRPEAALLSTGAAKALGGFSMRDFMAIPQEHAALTLIAVEHGLVRIVG